MPFDRFVRDILLFDSKHMLINEDCKQLIWIHIRSELSKNAQDKNEKKLIKKNENH